MPQVPREPESVRKLFKRISPAFFWISGKLFVEKCFQWSKKESLTTLYSEEIGFLYSVKPGLRERITYLPASYQAGRAPNSLFNQLWKEQFEWIKWTKLVDVWIELYNGLAGAMPRFVSCMKFVRSNIGHLMHSNSIKSIQLISIQQKVILEIPTLTIETVYFALFH